MRHQQPSTVTHKLYLRDDYPYTSGSTRNWPCPASSLPQAQASPLRCQLLIYTLCHICLCKQFFSRMLDIKTKKSNRLFCENDTRVVLAKVKLRISELVPGRQQQKSR
ncbi:hypothetical protein FHG87_009764 [Trinorchestia longiramus]|nr:hypothetical protein FHG87_009764 [Trinorchestia longiramus]